MSVELTYVAAFRLNTACRHGSFFTRKKEEEEELYEEVNIESLQTMCFATSTDCKLQISQCRPLGKRHQGNTGASKLTSTFASASTKSIQFTAAVSRWTQHTALTPAQPRVLCPVGLSMPQCFQLTHGKL